jgi:peptidoglycan lytic transglycosylase
VRNGIIFILFLGLLCQAPVFAGASELPAILEDSDRGLYKKIFAYQEKGRWRDANKQIKKLDNDLLMGHVLFQRYMHPTAYRTKYKELRDWLKKYRDLAEADRIYKLALRRRPKNNLYPPPPDRNVGIDGFRQPKSAKRNQQYEISRPKGKTARKLDQRIRNYVRQRKPVKAENILNRRDTKKLLTKAQYDVARARVAAGYYYANNDAKALSYAKAATRSRAKMFTPDWIAAITAWRSGDYLKSSQHFDYVWQSAQARQWAKSGAAFWAARGLLLAGQPEKVLPWLRRAARYPHSFYGLIAAHILDDHDRLNWTPPPISSDDMNKLMASKSVRRAMALREVGQIELAERELERVYWATGRGIAGPILAMAYRLDLPNLSYSIARNSYNGTDQGYDLALYPIPPWQPDSGFTVDRALVYAFMRQESHFDPKARNPSGATGLMQLMPRTARYISGNKRLKRRKLYDPGYNLDLGQKYLRYLLDKKIIANDLIKLTVAYNAGPGNFHVWSRDIDYHKDSLLFAESLPSAETRNFVERVLSNYWIYRKRFGQPTPSLDMVASGYWPKLAN